MNSKIQSQAFDRFLDPVLKMLTAEQTALLAEYKIDEPLQERIDELSEKCNEGELTDDERDEYEGYVRGNNYVGILKLKVRKLCHSRTAP